MATPPDPRAEAQRRADEEAILEIAARLGPGASAQEIADALAGRRTAAGGSWHRTKVYRVCARMRSRIGRDKSRKPYTENRAGEIANVYRRRR